MEENSKLNTFNKSNESKFDLYKIEKIPLYRDNIMIQTISNKIDILMDKEIEEKKEIIHNLFLSKLGPNFLRKPSAIKEFKSKFGKYILNLNKNIKINKKPVVKDKKKKNLDKKTEELNTRINMGNMTFLNLRENIVSNKSLINDKLFFLSKNFQISTKEKNDTLQLNNKLFNNSNQKKRSTVISLNKKKNLKENYNKDINLDIKNEKNINKVSDSKNRNNITENEFDNSFPIHNFSNSLSQYNLHVPKNIIKLKKCLIKNGKIEEKLNSIFSNSQSEFYSPKKILQQNFKTLPKKSEIILPEFKTIHLLKNISDSDFSSRIINNYKSLSKSQSNHELKCSNNIHRKNYLFINYISNFLSKIAKKKLKANLIQKTELLNKYTNKCNKNLVNLIDNNISKHKRINTALILRRKDNFNLIKALTDKKIPNKVFNKYNNNSKKIKSIFKTTQKEQNKLNNNKNFEEKYFVKNLKNMDDEIALYFAGELFDTKNIKFTLKEFRDQRNKELIKSNKIKLIKLKEKLSSNNYKIKKMKFNLVKDNNKCKDILHENLNSNKNFLI